MIRALPMRPLALVLSLAAVAAAGCGSSSKSKTAPLAASTPATPSTPSTPSTTTTTPASGFAAQVNALCKQGNTEARSATTIQQAGAIAEKLLPKFEALMPPAALKATYDEFIANTKKEVAAAKAGDKATLGQLTAKDHELGSKLGAPACA